MHQNLYDRIVNYAKDIESDNPLPRFAKSWQQDGLQTAREIYQHIKRSSGETAEEIAVRLQISPEYAKQTILALQNGGAKIAAVSEESVANGRHKHRYFIELDHD